MRDEIEFIVLASSEGDYVALPASVLERYGVPTDERDAIDERIRTKPAQGAPGPSWGFCGRFMGAGRADGDSDD